MKLLLDEMLPARIAEELRANGHDVRAVVEQPTLRSLDDAALLEHAGEEQRAVVTYNRDDSLALDRAWRERRREHHGIVILNPRRFAQGRSNRALTAALEAFLAAPPRYDGFVHWLGRHG